MAIEMGGFRRGGWLRACVRACVLVFRGEGPPPSSPLSFCGTDLETRFARPGFFFFCSFLLVECAFLRR
jgi:hypothetical protein